MKCNTYTFTVSHGDWSAVIETYSGHFLYNLADAILAAAHFENDHAFGFYEPDYFKLGSKYRKATCKKFTLFADMENCESDEDDLGVMKTTVSDVFFVGEPSLFLFDYGYDWRFDMGCTTIAMATNLKKKTAILSTTGTLPEQYPAYDGDG